MEKLAELQNLSPAERLRLQDAIWEHLERRSEKSPVPEWQRAILRTRCREYLLDPLCGTREAKSRDR